MKKPSLLVITLALTLFSSAQKGHTLMDSILFNLKRISVTDQQYRIPLDSTIKKYGIDSRQVDSLEDLMGIQDSINLAYVSHLLDTYGWIGRDSIGEEGDFVLFIVIQHSDLGTQQKYLPMMRDAVKKGNAKSSDLAYLEDRVALDEGRKQIYGTQLKWNPKTKKYAVAPIENEPDVDKRRAAVGLEPLEVYARNAGITYKLPPHPASQPAASHL